MHSTLTETMLRPIGSLYYTLVAINIYAWTNIYVFVDKLSLSLSTIQRLKSAVLNR